jgi:hypothetical protein
MKPTQTRKTTLKKKAKRDKIPRMIRNHVAMFDLEAAAPVYLRTGTTISSFSASTNLHYINIGDIIIHSNSFLSQLIKSGVPIYEMIRIKRVHITWYPSTILAVTNTFEPSCFDFRYFSCYSTDSVLPLNYYSNYNYSDLSVLLQQTNRPQSKELKLAREYIPCETNRQCLGQLSSLYNFANYGDQYGGILTIIQTIPSLNTISSYNPKLGYLEIKVLASCYNSVN